MLYQDKIWVGSSAEGSPSFLLPQMANRHGLIAGATGTGKTVSLRVLAEGFSDMGVPVFLGDIKGDLSGMVLPGTSNENITKRLQKIGISDFPFESYPTVFWDVYGQEGHPIRTTVKEMGALLLSRMLGLNETQSGILNILFRIAEHENQPLITIDHLQAMLVHIGNHASEYTLEYGNISKASIGAIQRSLSVLEDQGGNLFFGTPAFQIQDWMRCDENGKGFINVLACDRLFQSPQMYSTFLLWMLTKLYDTMPEIGDPQKPRMVFFFDEAHLLFDNCEKKLMEKIEQVVRLIRSKGIGVYFITQNPTDIPLTVLGQLGNRIQHALRAYTPLDQKAVKVAAQTFRTNPAFDTEEAITQLHTGEALVSFLDEEGAPGIVSIATILPPQSNMRTLIEEERRKQITQSAFYGKYEQADSYEDVLLKQRPSDETARSVWITMNTNPNGIPQPMQAAPSDQMTFMVFDPVSGQYVQKPIAGMNGAPQQPIIQQTPVVMPQQYGQVPVQQAYPYVQQPIAQQAPVMEGQQIVQPIPQQAYPYVQQPVQASVNAATPQTIEQNVFVTDPTTGLTYQKTITMAYNPVTGQYVQVMTEAEVKAAAKAKEKADAEAAKASKEAEAAARRERAEELREERAERARKNDSVVGRIKNAAISSATRTVTNKVINGVTKGIENLFK